MKDELSEWLGLHGGDNSIWTITLQNGHEIALRTDDLIDQDRFRAKVMIEGLAIPKRINPEKWPDVVKEIVRIASCPRGA